MPRWTHRLSHAGATFQYVLSLYRTGDDVVYVAQVLRDDAHFAIVTDRLVRDKNVIGTWSDATVELMAVIDVERRIREMV